jgi:hypothetical protein
MRRRGTVYSSFSLVAALAALTIILVLTDIPAAGKESPLQNAIGDMDRCKAKPATEVAKCAPFASEEMRKALQSRGEPSFEKIDLVERLMELDNLANYHRDDAWLNDRLAAYKSAHQLFVEIYKADPDAPMEEECQAQASFFSRLGPDYNPDRDFYLRCVRDERGEPPEGSKTLAWIQSAMGVYLATRGSSPAPAPTPSSAHAPTPNASSSTAKPATSPQGLTTSLPHGNGPGNNVPVTGQPQPSQGISKGGSGSTQTAGQGSAVTGTNRPIRPGQQGGNGSPPTGGPATAGCATGVPGDGPAGGGSGNCRGQATGTAAPSPRAFPAGVANQTFAGAGHPTGSGGVSAGSPGAGGCVPGDGPAGGCNGNVQTTGQVVATNADTGDAFPARGSRESGGPTNTDTGAGAMNSPESVAGAASNVGGSTNPGGWTDPLAADVASSNGGPASDDGSAYPVPTQQEIANTLNTGVSNSGEVSATPIATVADSNNWNQFSSSSETSPSNSTSASSPSTGSDTNAPAPDATDQQIDRDMLIAGKDKDALAKILPTNDISDNITDQGIAVEGAVAHQINHVINDADSSGFFSTASPGSGASVEQMNSDLVGFTPAIGNTFANAIPGYKYANALDQDVTNLRNSVEKVEKKAQSFLCLFSFDPYCK